MTPEQALQILDQAASRAALTRMDHVNVQQAIEVLRKATAEGKEKDKKAEVG